MTRYWVGGTGTWNASSTTHWSDSSGGASGFSVPTVNDDVVIDALSGAGTITTSGNLSCASLSMTSLMTLSLGGDFTTTDIFYFEDDNGTVNSNNHTITAGRVLFFSGHVSLGTSVINVNGGVECNLEIAGQSLANVSISNATVNFYGNVLGDTEVFFELGAGFTLGRLNIYTYCNLIQNFGAYTINTLYIDPGATVLFASSGMFNLTSFLATGTVSLPITIGCVSVLPFTLSKTSGTVTCDYLHISNSIASGGATWYAGSHSTNVINNTGWLFTDMPPTSNGTIQSQWYKRFKQS